ncbi:hypothetical protein GC105_00105 [Alkalibaculum sp. M08DMB]|uniref:DUF5673 domain-containing protein n=1 Tax=Alkalibaculum sporogenes TaxID=2655001 RepID=A0A6A7K4A7_9FIRM|nr:permease prefix domain 1-containing protein [Alkalibaculum sporogenes]MPW24201.1 hypothetical protein [Alkalibaculum sporogenes]
MRDQIDDYINSILISVLNTNVHQNITDELNDHILSLIEEKIEMGMEEEEALSESLKSIGDPKFLSRKYNSVYSISRLPLILWSVMNILLLSFIFFIILNQLRIFNTIDHLLFIVTILICIISLVLNIKYVTTLNILMKDNLIFVQHKYKRSSSYIENKTNKLFIVGYTILVLLIFSAVFVRIILEGFNQYLVDGNYSILMLLVMHSNYLLGIIVYFKYPKLIITDRGLYIFTDIPKLIRWDDFNQYKWIKDSGAYRLDLSNNKRYKKIYGRFIDVDKIVIDNILKNKKN